MDNRQESPVQQQSKPKDDTQIRLDEFLPFQLAVVANQVSQKIAKIIEKDFSLHIPEWRILATLSYHAPVSSQFLVSHTAMDPARVSRAQTRLSDLGLVSVRQDPDDKRRVLVNLTDHGAEIIAATLPSALEAEKDIFSALSQHELDMLDNILIKILATLQAENT
ncbi:MarR family winged helix-turn-helix transcriptional regulator [Yoonia sp. R2331]|uniref:MarR family winged helix-turn-helix transcriptional regulator n=1 Tax=Yoonia sp. R2331 TaxID=3237238 RepID=UPI0034E55C34